MCARGVLDSRLFKLLALEHAVTAYPIETNCYFVKLAKGRGSIISTRWISMVAPTEIAGLLTPPSRGEHFHEILVKIFSKRRRYFY